MKNVLFTTTAIVCLAAGGTAFAKAHDSGNFGISGTTDVGFNDEIEGGIFMETNIDIKAVKDAGNGFEVGGHARLNLDWAEGVDTDTTDGPTDVEFKSVYVQTPMGRLEYSDSSDGTSASDVFYSDRDGMTLDVQNLDGIASLRWSGEAGPIGYAIDTGSIENAASDDWSVGIGGEFGPVEVGLGYDNNSSASGDSVLGVSADFAVGPADVGVSYIDSDSDTSVGVSASVEIATGLTVGGYYATNDSQADDSMGVTLDYANGPLGVAIDYDMPGVGPDNFEIDVSYDVNDFVTVYAGYDDVDSASYIGATVMVADGIEATLAYAEADEIGGPEFKDGTSAYLTLTY